MLVIGRKRGEKITLYTVEGEITITVQTLTKNRVRLGIEAPSAIPIRRTEVEGDVSVSRRAESKTLQR